MGRGTYSQTAFNGGEINPAMYARVDQARRVSSVATLENFICTVGGQVTRRTGTRHVAAAKYADREARLVPFQFSVTQSYAIEMGDEYFRFFTDQGQIVDPNENVVNGDFTASIAGWTEGSDPGASMYWNSTLSAMALSGTGAAIARASQAVSTPNIGEIHQFETEALVGALTIRLGTTAGASNILGDTSFPVGTNAVTIIPTTSTTYLTIENQASAAHLADNVSVKLGYYEIASPYSQADLPGAKYVQTADLMYMTHPLGIRKLSRVSAAHWTISLCSFAGTPSQWTGSNFPGCIAIQGQRLVFGGTPNEPQTIWGSKVGNYEDFTLGAAANDGIEYELDSEDKSLLQWLVTAKVMFLGTAGGEWSAPSLDPTAPSVLRETTFGSNYVQARLVNNAVLFVQRHGKEVRELRYGFAFDSYDAANLMDWAEHLGSESTLIGLDFSRYPHPIMWVLREDGVLLGLTYDRGHEVVGWHRHVTDGLFESIAVIPGDGRDELWALVNRTIGGTAARYIEFFEDEDFGSEISDAFFVDSGLTYDGTPVTTLGGLTHLIGETVKILADGAVRPPQVVNASGQITLATAASKIHVGLGFTSTLWTLPWEAAASEGTAQGKKKRLHKIAMRFLKTVGGRIGSDPNDTDEIPFREPGDAMDTAIPLFTGWKYAQPKDSGADVEGQLAIVQEEPLPMTILALVEQGTTGDLVG